MTRIDLERLRSIGVISARSRSRVTGGREHPESGKPYRAVKDELGNVVTEHGQPGTGVSDRQDVHITAPHITAAAGE